MLEVMTRRYYRIRELGSISFHRLDGQAFAVAGYRGVVTAALSPAEQAALAGNYAMGPAVMTIIAGEQGMTAQLTGQPPIKLEALGKRELRTVGVDARLSFEEKDGRIARVILHQNGRTIPFERKP